MQTDSWRRLGPLPNPQINKFCLLTHTGVGEAAHLRPVNSHCCEFLILSLSLALSDCWLCSLSFLLILYLLNYNN